MNEFKINIHFKDNTNEKCSTFQSIMNDLFLLFIKNKIIETCDISPEELIYNT